MTQFLLPHTLEIAAVQSGTFQETLAPFCTSCQLLGGCRVGRGGTGWVQGGTGLNIDTYHWLVIDCSWPSAIISGESCKRALFSADHDGCLRTSRVSLIQFPRSEPEPETRTRDQHNIMKRLSHSCLSVLLSLLLLFLPFPSSCCFIRPLSE